SFNESLKQFRELLSGAPSELEWRRGVGEQLDQLGQMHKSQKDPRVRQDYDESLELRQGIAKDAPDDWRTYRDIASTQNDLGEYIMLTSQPQEALDLFRKAQENADKALGLVKNDAKGLEEINWRKARVLVSISQVFDTLKRNEEQKERRVALGKTEKAALE